LDGVDYHFWREEHFRRGIADNMFFEHEEVHGNLYGTLKGSLEEVISKDESAVIILDVYGAIRLKDTFPVNTVNVFLTCSTRDELRRRIESRGTSPDEVARRLGRASKELSVYSDEHQKFDYLIVNDDLSTSRLALQNITVQEGVRAGKCLRFEDDIYD
jgi:guanylate kinase